VWGRVVPEGLFDNRVRANLTHLHFRCL
jgi:hypothetical protein